MRLFVCSRHIRVDYVRQRECFCISTLRESDCLFIIRHPVIQFHRNTGQLDYILIHFFNLLRIHNREVVCISVGAYRRRSRKQGMPQSESKPVPYNFPGLIPKRSERIFIKLEFYLSGKYELIIPSP